MAKLPEAGAKVTLDVSEWERKFSGVIGDAGKLDALDPTVKINVNDTDLKTAIGLANDLDKSVTTKVNVDDADVRAASDKLDDIAAIGAIDLAINVAGTAKTFLEGLGRFSGVGGIMELDSALATIEARTGRMIPQAEELINKLYANGWGESRTQIAGVVAQAAQLGLEGDALEAAVLATLQVVSVTGGDAAETLNKLDTAAKANGLTFTETADLFVAGYQSGNDKADDLLDTLSEYGTTFKNFKLSAEGALAFLDSGLSNGVFNSDVLADSVRELGIRLASIGTDENVTKAFKDLDKLSDVDLAGLLDGYEAGTVTGDDMLQGIIDAISDVSATDPGKATTLGAAIVGTQLEDMGVTVFSKLSTDADTAFGTIEGRAESAGNAISDTLAVTVDTFLRSVEQMAVDFLSSDSVNLDGKIEEIKKGLQKGMGVLGSGGTVGEALEVGLNIPGLSDTLDTFIGNFERIIGNLEIAFLQVVAIIQDITGHGAEAAGTRRTISDLATGQLSFDLQLANPDELTAIVQTAFDRGVSKEGVEDAISTALNETVSKADFGQGVNILQGIIDNPNATDEFTDQVVSDYITKLKGGFENALSSGNINLLQDMLAIEPNAAIPGLDAAVTDMKKQLSDAFAPKQGGVNDFNPFTQTFKGISDAFTSGILAPDAGGKTGATGGGILGNLVDDVTDSVAKITEGSDTAGIALDHISTATGTVATDATTDMQTVATAFNTAAVAADLMDQGISLSLTDNTVTASFEAVALAAQTSFPAVIAWFERTSAAAAAFDMAMTGHVQHILNMLHDLQFLSAQVATGVEAAIALGGALPPTPVGAGGGSSGGSNDFSSTTIVINNNVPNGAAAAANGYALGASLRGN